MPNKRLGMVRFKDNKQNAFLAYLPDFCSCLHSQPLFLSLLPILPLEKHRGLQSFHNSFSLALLLLAHISCLGVCPSKCHSSLRKYSLDPSWGPFEILKSNLCLVSCSPSFFSDLGLCRVLSSYFSISLCSLLLSLCGIFLHVFPKAPHLELMGSAMSCTGSVTEVSGIICVQH